MEELTISQNEQDSLIAKTKKERQIIIGQVIILAIVFQNIVSGLYTAVVNRSITSFVVTLALSMALYWGVTWVKYLSAVGGGLGAILGVLLIPYFIKAGVPASYILYMAYLVITGAACCILLFKSQCVNAFLYYQKQRRGKV